MRLLLIGLPKVGKSSVGIEAARALKLPFIDLDQEMERAVGCSPRQLVQSQGMEYFRLQEQHQLFKLNEKGSAVVALGGGIIELPANRDFLKQCGIVVYLENDPEEIWDRFEGVPSYLDPADPKGSFLQLAAKRRPLYEAVAHHRIVVKDLSIPEIVGAIVRLMVV